MNQRLPGPAALIPGFPRSPVERPQRFIQQPNFRSLGKHVIERGLNERDLLPNNLRLNPLIRRRHSHRVPSSLPHQFPGPARGERDLARISRSGRANNGATGSEPGGGMF